MKKGTLCKARDPYNNPSLYRNEAEFHHYAWQGLTPPHENGCLRNNEVVMFLETVSFDGVTNEIAKILHKEGIFYIVKDFLKKAKSPKEVA